MEELNSMEEFDVLIVGAGISGIGAAYHLTHQRPGTKFVVLDALDNFGGTWWSHRYPGIRSDSDLHTFGYRFKPWNGPPIATAEEILKYMGEVIEDNELDQHIRYYHKVTFARWSSEKNLWEIEAKRTDNDERHYFTANFLWMCQGYYRHWEGYTPEWPGREQYQGRIAHTEAWPENIEYTDKKVVVIGSGATAATIVPAMASSCEHITIIQRSPTYFRPGRNQDDLAETLRQLDIDDRWIHEIVRRKILRDQAIFVRRTFTEPDKVKEELIEGIRTLLKPEIDVETHFNPEYRPWQQRLAFVPDGDMFQGINSGKVSIETDEIDTFTKHGILLKSGKEISADLIITATGFNMNVLGDIEFRIDEKPMVFSDTVTYRGMMFTGIPNLLWVFGYFRASWTLRADLLADFVCRLLAHMEKIGANRVDVELREQDRNMELLPWIDPKNFNPGYLMRALGKLPLRGDKPEWQHTQDYWREKDEIPAIDLSGSEFIYK
jgi:cation diffusion facilitator CzcD-associated flavoprotein CzcO